MDGDRDTIYRHFSGTIDAMGTRIKGKWGQVLDQYTNLFDFSIGEPVGANLYLRVGSAKKEDTQPKRVEIDFQKMKI